MIDLWECSRFHLSWLAGSIFVTSESTHLHRRLHRSKVGFNSTWKVTKPLHYQNWTRKRSNIWTTTNYNAIKPWELVRKCRLSKLVYDSQKLPVRGLCAGRIIDTPFRWDRQPRSNVRLRPRRLKMWSKQCVGENVGRVNFGLKVT
mgnify:CR=1 FL=1